MSISIDAEKAFNKIQHLFMIINPPESTHRWNLWQHNKDHIWRTHCQHCSQWWETETVSSKFRKKEGCPDSPLLFNIVLDVLATPIREEKEIKGIQTGKE